MVTAVEKLAIPGLCLIRTRRHADARGWFAETYRSNVLAAHGIATDFVQDNAAQSARRGTVRGLHFQRPPSAQGKLVRVVRGAIFDVAVDLRRGSPAYGRWVGVDLSAENCDQLFIPRGLAHGYCTMQDDTEVAYKCDGYYAPETEAGIVFDDPVLAIDWPIAAGELICSERDRKLPRFDAFATPFTFDP